METDRAWQAYVTAWEAKQGKLYPAHYPARAFPFEQVEARDAKYQAFLKLVTGG